MKPRTYMDWNATAPLRPEARNAMLAALDIAGNPSSVHAEGRQARAIVERARAQVAEAIGASAAEIVFTSGASEAAALGLAGRNFHGPGIEHDCVSAWIEPSLATGPDGAVSVNDPSSTVLQAANSETGVLQNLPHGLACIDAVQAVGKVPFAFDWLEADRAIISSHKLGGPKGVGALVLRRGVEPVPQIRGGGQELGRRAGTENVAGIAGFGAASAAAARDLADGVWSEVQNVRDYLEAALESVAPGITFVARHAGRLPNTSCFAVRGWKSETQVMQMDLSGFAVSAGSACSSGKVRKSRVLREMGYDDEIAASAIRVSIGPGILRSEIDAFVEAWSRHLRRFRQKAA